MAWKWSRGHLKNGPIDQDLVFIFAGGLVIAEILGDPYDKKVPLPRIPNSQPLGSRHNTHVGQYCHTGNSALWQFCLSDNRAVGQFWQQYRDTPRIATSGPQPPMSSLQWSIAFLDTHDRILNLLLVHKIGSIDKSTWSNEDYKPLMSANVGWTTMQWPVLCPFVPWKGSSKGLLLQQQARCSIHRDYS